VKGLKDLNFSKEKLFTKGDYTKWGVNESSMSVMDLVNLKHDKEKAFTYMLPNVIFDFIFTITCLGNERSRQTKRRS
jgi:hypothetical protein